MYAGTQNPENEIFIFFLSFGGKFSYAGKGWCEETESFYGTFSVGWKEGKHQDTHKVHVDVTSEISSKRILILSFMKVKVCFYVFPSLCHYSNIFSFIFFRCDVVGKFINAKVCSSPSGAFQLRDENLNSRRQMMIMSSWWKLSAVRDESLELQKSLARLFALICSAVTILLRHEKVFTEKFAVTRGLKGVGWRASCSMKYSILAASGDA